MKEQSTPKRTEWVTIKQVMPIIKCTCRNGVERFAHRHRLRRSKPAGKVLFDVDEVYAAIDADAKRMGL